MYYCLVAACVLALTTLVKQSAYAAPASPSVEQAWRKSPARTITPWKHYMLKPLDERYAAAPPFFVDFLNLDNQRQGWTERPRAKAPDEALVRDLRKALVDMPPRLKVFMRDRLIGVYVVEDLGGSAMTETVYDEKGRPAFGVIALDAKALDKKANEWMSWKESTPYKQDPLIKIEATIEEHIYNDRASALQYILLHEMGHVFAIGRPDLLQTDVGQQDLATKPFTASAWSWQKDRYVSRYDRTVLPQRLFIKYYAKPHEQIVPTAALQTYKNLGKTNFATPYAITNPHDDFADTFANYIHTQWMRKPWSIKYIYQGKTEYELKPCWDTGRCEERQALLEKILSAK